MSKERRPIGVICTGLMGMACAKRLRAAGFEILGYDTDAEKLKAFGALGGHAASAVAEIARSCDTVVIAVFNTDQVEETVEGPRGLLATRPLDALSKRVSHNSACAAGERGGFETLSNSHDGPNALSAGSQAAGVE